LQIQRGRHGEEHPSTLASYNNLAGILQDVGPTAEGLTLMLHVEKVTRKRLGPARFMTQRSATVLRQAMIANGDYKQATEVMMLCVEECLEYFGELHSLTLDARLGLGTAADYSSDLELAEDQLLTGLDGLEQTLGEDSDRALATRNNLAMMLQAARRMDDAEELLRINLEIWPELGGKQSPGTLRAMHNLGFEHPETLASAINAARLLRYDGELEQAIAMLEEILVQLPGSYWADSAYIEQCRVNLAEMRKALAQ
jgi:tetratricopeptide (TPR) repeat protein